MRNLIITFSLILLICCSSMVLIDNINSDNINSEVKAGYQTNVTQGRLLWSGINWRVYTQMENNTWVDYQGRLHMKLQKIGDSWYRTELDSPTKYLYGKFIWNVNSTSLQFERNTSIGLFTYTDDSHEIDIEINQWPGYEPRLWFTNQPGSLSNNPDNIHYSVYNDSPYLGATNVTYTFDWEPTYINYSAINSDGSLISNWNYTNASAVPHVAATLIEDIGTVMRYTPVSGQPKEIVFNSFQYIASDFITNSDVDFCTSPLSGTAPLKVTFIDLSKNAAAWNWDFGDGYNSTQQNPMHTYSAAGNYTVNLTVSNANGTKSKLATITVLKPSPPVANFSSNVISGYAPLSVKFNDSSDKATGWNWDFGDGANSTDQNPVHTYSTAGNYTVSLTVSNVNGTDSKTSEINIKNSPTGPFAYITNSDSDTVSIIDISTNNITATVKVGNHPWGVAVSSDGKKAYVTNVFSNSVSVIDTATNTVGATVKGFYEPWGIAVSPDGKKAYVANSASNKVSVIDTAKNTVAATVTVGNNPRGIVFNPDGTKVYVTNQNNNSVSVINTATNNIIATVSAGSQPWGLSVTLDGTKVYVANYGNSRVSVIDATTNTVSATVPVGLNPVGVAFTPDGKKAYVTNYVGNTVSIINTTTNTVTTTFRVGTAPYGVAFIPNGTKAYIANSASNNVSVIDTATNTVIATVDAGQSVAFGQFIVPPLAQPALPIANFSTNVTSGYAPLSVQFTDLSQNVASRNWDFGDGTNSTDQNPAHTYSTAGNYTVNLKVSNAYGTDSKTSEINIKNSPTGPFAYITNSSNGTVSVIDTTANNVTATVKVGNHPWGVAVSSDRKKAYVTNVFSNSVSVIDTAKNTVVATVKGFYEPWGIAVSPDGKKAYVANSASNKVSVIDTAKNTVAATVTVGNNPRGIVVIPDGTKVYVTNQNNNSVSVIDTATNAVKAKVNVGSQPWGIAVSPDETKVYVANYGSSTVSVIGTITNNVSATMHVGSNPVGVAFTPDGKKAYVTNYVGNTVSIINTTTNTVTTTVRVGKAPYGVAFIPNGTKAYIANSASNNISVIDTATNTVIATVDAGQSVAFGQFIVPPLAQHVLPIANSSSNVTSGYAPQSSL